MDRTNTAASTTPIPVPVVTAAVGFAPEEITTAESTRSARLKWVVVVDAALPPGRQVNAAVCVSAATAVRVAGLLGPDGTDADGHSHPGLPWAGCTVLSATSAQLAELGARTVGDVDLLVVDMPESAQTNRVYDEYLGQLATTATDGIARLAISIVGPRNRVDRLVKRLSLLG